MIDEYRTRVRLAARQAEVLYPGTLGRLVAHELTTCADRHPGLQPGGLAESVVHEVLGRTPTRRHTRRPLVRSGDFPSSRSARH